MKLTLTHKEANLLMAILWDLANEGGQVIGSYNPVWRLTDNGREIAAVVMDKLDEANDKQVRKTGKDRDLSGAPTGTIQEAKWSE